MRKQGANYDTYSQIYADNNNVCEGHSESLGVFLINNNFPGLNETQDVFVFNGKNNEG